jgi:hypothetical protein
VNWYDPNGLDQCPSGTFCLSITVYSTPLSYLTAAGNTGHTPYPFISWFQVDKNGGGGGSKERILQVTNVQKNGKDYNKVKNRLLDIENLIDPDCLSFLQSGGSNLGSYVSDLLSNDLLAVAQFTGTFAAFTNSAGTTLPPGTAITVNDIGAFFSNNYTVDEGNLTGGTARAQAFILLHELGHALGSKGFQPDLNKPSAGKANDKLIDTNCKKTLSEFSSR